MKIGFLKEKNGACFLLPEQVEKLTKIGHTVYFSKQGLKKIKISYTEYTSAGAIRCKNNSDVIKRSEIILKISAFSNKEINLCSSDKLLISLTNYAFNAKMVSVCMQKKIRSIF